MITTEAWEVDLRSRTNGNSIETIYSGNHDDACEVMQRWYREHDMSYEVDLESYVDGSDGVFADLYATSTPHGVGKWEDIEDEYREDCCLSNARFEKVKQKVIDMKFSGWEIYKIVACIYDLFQSYLISETQETILYNLADPKERFNNCSGYWRDMNYENPLIEIVK